MPSTSLKDMAQTISAAVEPLDAFYDTEKEELSFPSGSKPNDGQQKNIEDAFEALFKLQRMLLGPIGSLRALGGHQSDQAALHVIFTHGIDQHVPDEGTTTYADIAAKCSVSAINVSRLLRYAMTTGLFREVAPGQVAHTASSKRLAHDPLVRSIVSMLCCEQFPAAPRLAEAMDESRPRDGARASAWALANGSSRPMMQELEEKHPERARQFAAFMKLAWVHEQPVQSLVDSYDWAAIGKGHVVDVGGGLGHVSIALARAFPQLSFTVQDFASTVERGERELPTDLKTRVKFQAHDFFEPQPDQGADIYLLRSVLHDWPDEMCVSILQALVPSMRPGSRVLINDICSLPPGKLPLMAERRARTLDLIMGMLFNAREREKDEWAPLFSAADPRYKFRGVRLCSNGQTERPDGKMLSIIEAVWEG